MLDLRRWDSCLQATRGVDEIYNLAADMGGIGYITEFLADIARNNSLINTHMLEAARVNEVQRFFYSSSACIYPGYLQDSPDVTPLKESDAYPADPEEGIQMALRTTWSLACTGKFVWPIPDKGLKKRLHRISSPTLLLWGEDDGIVPPVYADEFASSIEDTAIQIIPKAGHLPQLEQLEPVVSVTNKFLTS